VPVISNQPPHKASSEISDHIETQLPLRMEPTPPSTQRPLTRRPNTRMRSVSLSPRTTQASERSVPVQTFKTQGADLTSAERNPLHEIADIVRRPVTQKFRDGSARIDYVAEQFNKADTLIPFAKRVSGKAYVSSDGKEVHTDGHFHPTNYVQRGFLPKELLGMMDQLNIRNCVLMPIPTSLQAALDGATLVQPALLKADVIYNKGICTVIDPTAKSNDRENAHSSPKNDREIKALGSCCAHHHCDPLPIYYIPKEIEKKYAKDGLKLTIDDFIRNPKLIDEIAKHSTLYIDTSVNSTLAAHMRLEGLNDAQRSRFDPMLTGFNLGDVRAGEKLLATLFLNKDTFTGIGEITVHKELVEEMYADKRGQATTQKPGGLVGLINLMEMAGVVGAPVVLHCDIDDLKLQINPNNVTRREPANFAGLRELFLNPQLKDTTIVWAHGGGLGRFVQQGEGHLERLDGLLKECPNLHLDISWAAVAKQVNKNPERQKAWAKFLEKNSEKICFGSDALAPASLDLWEETKTLYKDVLDKLPPSARNNLLNSTYERVFVNARENIRNFESKVLTPEFYKNNVLSSTGTDNQQPISAATVRAFKERVM
jgi:hypothetical protein